MCSTFFRKVKHNIVNKYNLIDLYIYPVANCCNDLCSIEVTGARLWIIHLSLVELQNPPKQD